MRKPTAKSKVLPRVPSKLIRLALADLRKCELSPRKFKIDMGRWVKREKSKCAVCLAGAVMVQRLSVRPPRSGDSGVGLFGVSGENRNQLYALNALRSGYLADAFSILDLDLPEGLPRDADITPHASNPEAFRRDMRNLAALLRSHGF